VAHQFSRKSNQQETKNWCGTTFQEKQSTGNKKVVAHHFSRKNNQQETKQKVVVFL
jgi:hypothetical protein